MSTELNAKYQWNLTRVAAQVNKQLDKMGYNIGVRLIEDFLAHSPGQQRCTQLEEAADIIAKQGFRMFLGLYRDGSRSSQSEGGGGCAYIMTKQGFRLFHIRARGIL